MARSDFRFCFPLRVRFTEIDSQAVVFNSRYLEYFDHGIVEYFRAVGLFGAAGPMSGPPTHVVKAVVEFRAPILLDERIEVCVRCARIGNTSITLALEVHGAGVEDLRAVGEEVHVHITESRGRPSPWPAAVVSAFESFEGHRLSGAAN